MKTNEIRTNIYLCDKDLLYKREQQTLKDWKSTERNKELINEYITFLFAKGSGTLRATKVSSQLRNICNTLISINIHKDLSKLDFKDIEQLISAINKNKLHTNATKADYRRMVRAFYNWFKENDTRLLDDNKQERETAIKLYNYIQKHVKQSYKHNIIDYSNIITKEDCDKAIDNAPTIMEKTILSVLYETGCRIGEFLGIRIQDIEIKDNYALIRVDGKTGERRIPITQSLVYLIRHLDEHLDKHNPQSLLWISKSHKFKGKPLHYIGVRKILKRTFKHANIAKKCNPHWFRHSRATMLASDYSEQIMCKIFGWEIGSKEVRTYVHIGTKQVEDTFKQVNGLKTSEQIKPSIQKCICGTINEQQAKYCYKCGKALNIGTFVQDQEILQVETDNRIQYLLEILQNPEVLKRFEEFKKTRA